MTASDNGDSASEAMLVAMKDAVVYLLRKVAPGAFRSRALLNRLEEKEKERSR